MSKERVHAIIHGRVQGVFFRASTQEKAIELGLTGWVRNRADGKVELLAEGEKEKLEKLIEWCRIGPKHAQVTNVETRWEPYAGQYNEFIINYQDR
jgi:acylphosphatase